MKKRIVTMFIVSVLLIGLAGCGSTSPDTAPAESTVEESAGDSIDTADLESTTALIEDTLKESFGDEVSVTYDDNMIIASVWRDGVAEGVASAMSGDDEMAGMWKDVRVNLGNVASSVHDLVYEVYGDSVNDCFFLLNDQNQDNYLLMYLNGELVFDITESDGSDAEEADTSDDTTTETTSESNDAVSADYRNALKSAESYSSRMHMSKAAIYDQLTSEYGGQFEEDAAQYAIDNLAADWNANALASAESYSETMHMSKAAIYDQLTSEYGGQFTAEEAQYAIDNIEADWNANALASAKSYQENMNMSTSAIYDQLVSEYGGQFTAEEAQYAIDNLE